jgi:hypothetical protein
MPPPGTSRDAAGPPPADADPAPGARRPATLGHMLLLIAVLGVTCAAFRAHISLGSALSGMLALAWRRTADVARECRRRGTPLSRRRHARLIAGSTLVAAVLMGVAVAAALFGGMVAILVMPVTTAGPSPDLRDHLPTLLAGAFAGWVAFALLGRVLWPYAYPPPDDHA